MSMILDVIFFAVILIFALIGYKRGFIKEIISLVGVIVALGAAFYISKICADFVFQTFIKNSVIDKISATIVSTADNSVNGVVNVIPEYIVSFAKTMGFDLTNVVNNNIAATLDDTAVAVATSVVEQVVSPLIVGILNVVLFIVLFIIFKIIINLITKALNLVAKLPVIKSANKVLGLAVGLLRGVLVVIILCYVLILVVTVSSEGLFGITSDELDSSFIINVYNKIFSKLLV